VPARFKFLKSDRSENSLILGVIKRLALTRPDLALTYSNLADTSIFVGVFGIILNLDSYKHVNED
jgi:DNA mismatch repair ATPase MutL